MQKNRTEKSIRNFIFGVVLKCVYIIVGFVSRTFFINLLNAEYLGINSLFSNILTLLSVAELDIGLAIVFSMYQPIANNDREKIKSLLLLYKKIYRSIGLIVFLLGIALIPFLDSIVGNIPNVKENIILIYILFLLNTTISYLFSYKKSIISASQNEYINTSIHVSINVFMNMVQIIFLAITHNYIGFLIIQLISTVVESGIYRIKANKLFPYITDTNVKKLTKSEKGSIFKNTKNMVIYKIGSILVDNSDNVIISSMLGVVSVGLYSNYYMLIMAVSSVLRTGINGLTSSIGNLNISQDNDKKEEILKDLLFVCNMCYMVFGILFLCLANDFVKIWIGEEYLVNQWTVVAIVLSFYINGIQVPGYFYRITTDVISIKNIMPIVAVILNILLSVILGNYFGLFGILLATGISRGCTTLWNDIYNVYKYVFKKSSCQFFRTMFVYIVETVILAGVCIYISNFLLSENIIQLVIKTLVMFTIICVTAILLNYRRPEYTRIIKRVKNIYNKVRKEK